MNEKTGKLLQEVRQVYVGGGAKLEIVATEDGLEEWSLSVINERGVASTWMELFRSSEAAIDAALRAIEEEGVGEFTSIEGFEYLDDDA